jgi:hypothetical protein
VSNHSAAPVSGKKPTPPVCRTTFDNKGTNFMINIINDEEQAFIKAVEKGLADIEEGRCVSLPDVKIRLGLDVTPISSNKNL